MRRIRAVTALAALALLLTAAGSPTLVAAAPAGQVHAPNLQTVIPPDSFSIVQTATGREFRYTHLVYNSGPGPLEVQPSYDQATGGYRGTQLLFTHNPAGAWSQVGTRRVPDVFVYHAEHGHFHFPLASFGLYAVGSDGGVGAPVARSPKTGFCIDDSYIYNPSIEHAGAFVGSRSSCTDPTGLRGISVGGADEYDYRDPGQAVPIDGVADGTYWFRALSDPNNDFVEADESDNETDVRVTIAGDRVTAGAVRQPDSTPPAVAITSPSDGTLVKGGVDVTATTAGPADAVELLVDGIPVARAQPGSGPTSLAWDSRSVTDGSHWLAVRATDALGRIGTSAALAVVVGNVAPPSPEGPLTLATSAFSDGTGAQTATVSGLTGGEQLLALVSADGQQGQSATVTSEGMAWVLVQRANTQLGTSEIWKAVVGSGTSAVSATATLDEPAYDASLTLLAFRGSGGVGAASGDGASNGAAATALTTTSPGSLVVGVGNDWDSATARTVRDGEVMVHEYVDRRVGDTFWAQASANAIPAPGTRVTSGTSAPAEDRWNYAAAEVVAASTAPQPPDTTAPGVMMTDPEAGASVAGLLRLSATATDNVAVTQVVFEVDGVQVGAPVTTAPFTTTWDTTRAAGGPHAITARASDAAGNTTRSAPVLVTVDNTAPPVAAIAIDAKVTVARRGTLTTPGLRTTQAGDTLLAFVAADGPGGAGQQSAVVTGAGLAWSLVKRSNTQSGAAEIWAARATSAVNGAAIRATPTAGGFWGSLTVIAFAGASGTNVAGAAGAPTGAPSIYLPGVATGSWVFAVGNDWDSAASRVPAAGQVVEHEYLAPVGDTFWVQRTATPAVTPGLVTIADTAPSDHQWNYAAVEVTAAPGS